MSETTRTHKADCACHLCQLNDKLGDMICEAMEAEQRAGMCLIHGGANVANVVARRLAFHCSSVITASGAGAAGATAVLTGAVIVGSREGNEAQARASAAIDAERAVKH